MNNTRMSYETTTQLICSCLCRKENASKVKKTKTFTTTKRFNLQIDIMDSTINEKVLDHIRTQHFFGEKAYSKF